MNRLTPGTLIMALFAVLFALVAAYTVRRYLASAPLPIVERPVVPGATATPLASRDLEPGHPLTEGDIALIPLTAAQRRERGLPPEMMGSAKQIIGRILSAPMKKGEAFEPSKLYPEGTVPSLADRLRPGLRAVPISVPTPDLLAGIATPGSHVDVLFRTAEQKDAYYPQTTVTLVQNAEILAVGDNWVVGSSSGLKPNVKMTTVTLAVTDEDARRLTIVEGRGELSIALRSPVDTHGRVAKSDGIAAHTLESLLGIPPRPVPFVSEVYRRGARQTLKFENSRITDESFSGLKLASPPPPDKDESALPAPQANQQPALMNWSMPVPWVTPFGVPIPYAPGMTVPGPMGGPSDN